MNELMKSNPLAVTLSIIPVFDCIDQIDEGSLNPRLLTHFSDSCLFP
jgi:hypothetical protein